MPRRQGLHNGVHHMHVGVGRQHRSRPFRPELACQFGVLLEEILDKAALSGKFGVDLLPMVLIIRQGRVDFGQRQAGVNAGGNFFRRQSSQIAGSDDIAHPNPVAGYARLSGRDARRINDVGVFSLGCNISTPAP